jgi:hypothetical protein
MKSKNPVILSDIHHLQNTLKSTRLKVSESDAEENIWTGEEKVT